MHWPAALARTAHGRRKACGSPITRTCTNQAAGPKRVLGQANTAVADSASTVPEKNSNSAPSDCAQVILFNDLLAVCSHTPADGRLSVLHRISLFGAEVLVALSLPRTAPPALCSVLPDSLRPDCVPFMTGPLVRRRTRSISVTAL